MLQPVNIANLREKLDANKMKAILLHWARFCTKQNYKYISTEASTYNADVYAMNDKESIEIEIKISKADLKKDAEKSKHRLYRLVNNTDYRYQCPKPNRFYYAVPIDLVETAKSLIEELNPNYGVLCVEFGRVTVVKSAGLIHNNKPIEKLKHIMAMRMSSEIINLQLAKLKQEGEQNELSHD